MTKKIYGYCRISTKEQSIDRQIRNIKNIYEGATIVEEVFTGRKIEGRKQFDNLLKKVKKGDTIVFDSVSRMSRNAEEGFKLYKDLLNKGIELEFIKEQHISTTTFKKALGNKIESTGNLIADKYINTTNEVIELIAEQQIKIAFEQSEKEVNDLSQRTKEGIETARLKGKQIGLEKGTKLTTKKSVQAKEQIQKYSKDFQGTLKDTEVMKLIGLARNTYYKYKKELVEELQQQEYTSTKEVESVEITPLEKLSVEELKAHISIKQRMLKELEVQETSVMYKEYLKYVNILEELENN